MTAAKIVPPKRDPRTGEPLTTGTPSAAKMSVGAAARVGSPPGFVRPNTRRDPTAGRVIEGGTHEFGVSSEPQGIVYALLDREVCQVKIGFTSKSAHVRQREHERRRGRPLDLLGVMRGGRSLERAMHARFADHRAEREWFRSEIAAELLPLLDGEA